MKDTIRKPKVLTINRTPADFVSDTQHLTTLEIGAYQMICDALVIRGQDSSPPSLPDDDAMLSNITRLSRAKWRRVRTRLVTGNMAVLIASNGRIYQVRTAIEIEKARVRIDRSSAAGQASGEARRIKADMKERIANDRSSDVQ